MTDLFEDLEDDIPARVTPPAFAHSRGSHEAKIALVGESWGKEEEKLGRPFIGWSGQELTKMLEESGISPMHAFYTNVLALRPPNNNFALLCDSKKAVGGKDYTLPQVEQGKYLRPEYLPELDRLREELETVRPNLVVALGAKAAWALLRTAGIASIRGTTAESTLVPGLKVLPTYHPAHILRNYSVRVIMLQDLMKASREMQFPEVRRPARQVLVFPTFDEIEHWYETYGRTAKMLAVDIETSAGQITDIGFACSRTNAIVFTFATTSRKAVNAYASFEDEVRAWKWVDKFLELPAEKLFQNGLYDLQYIWRAGMRPRNVRQDTMLLHHSIWPELQKGLGFMGSIYTNEPAWKLMHKRKKEEQLKRDE